MRLVIACVWLVSFLAMWIIFKAVLPDVDFNVHLDRIEKNVEGKDWNNAKKSMNELKNLYNRKKVVIQMNNATEIFTTFDLTMGQLESSIEHEQEAAIEYIGAIRESLDFVMKAFSGP